MTSRDKYPTSHIRVLDRIKDLSPALQKKIQKELLEYIDFLEFKYTPKKSKKAANPELSQEQRKELLRRLEHAKKYPEKLITAQEMKSKWGRKLGIQL
ncbi:MAG: hypothetical protein KA146_12060 [Leptospiraceae bacterium]|jgi:hypothetical protein|nr:hypothetical protein [Leptospiraceae bacterium]